MIIATWNINGIKARLEVLKAWLKEASPDVVCLQEIKSIDENFPAAAIEELGYNVATHGQKGFNGVAILSKRPFDELIPRLPGDESDEQARYLEAVISGDNGVVRVASIYLPNGNPVDTEKYPYKLSWMDRLISHAQSRLADEEPLVLAGDYNVIPQDGDCYSAEAWAEDALALPQTPEPVPHASGPWLYRCAACGHPRRGHLHLLGLSGWRMAAQQWHPHRPPVALTTSSRPAEVVRNGSPCARLGETL